MKPSPIKEEIVFEDFEKLDIRVGTITTVTDVEKSNKLMKLTVDLVTIHVLYWLVSSKNVMTPGKSKENRLCLY